ncbi:hypothetical protein [Novipirellula artificiosorum]|uniref:Uncharacterized protein n=1 Tax=Novipirellula artificiosorum TaxID=2528016 RepID=A0A5C6DW54_9BACT|nr:hypothetical protein [Novipirellula artificiosorum]TWU39286.1 hypothetical protein Poly41_21100 [Novipirellula artificiosorum]
MKKPFETIRVEVATVSNFLAITFLFLPAIVGLTSCVTAYGDDLPFRITTKRDDDKVEVKVEEGKTHFTVQSPVGISQAIIERSGENWPTTVMLRLRLKGLEKFKVTDGKITLEASVSSQDGKVRLWKDGKEDSPLDSKHPYWMEIRMVGKDGKPVKTIPLKEGYFEMKLPKALFEDNPKSITLSWIDFYR